MVDVSRAVEGWGTRRADHTRAPGVAGADYVSKCTRFHYGSAAQRPLARPCEDGADVPLELRWRSIVIDHRHRYYSASQ